ncbi:MAG: carbamoyltransferase [Planctomycetes bacterium]|nr:carbamoyltransferase [Planctomycetota bacterium]
MRILGISAFFHDSAAALVEDGRIVAAAQEERFSRRKHDERFPQHAVAYCLGEAGIAAGELDAVVFYEKPLLKFERLLETALAFAPRGFPAFLRSMPPWLQRKLHLPREIDRGLGGAYSGPILFATHHESHAASAFFPSPFDEAAILTIDGVGEWTTASWGVGRGNRIELREEMRFPHSLGLLYSAFTLYCGFRVNSGEYKLMGLAPYGTPHFRDLILERIVRLHEDGSIWLDQRHFDYCAGLHMTSRAFHDLFGGPPRDPETPLTQREMDIAASIQAVTEEVVLRMARHVHARTGMRNLCLAGGVALNCVANGRVLREGPFERLWIQPAAGDAGGALGAALAHWHGHLGNARTPQAGDSQQGSYLGPAATDVEIVQALDRLGAVHHELSEEALCESIAEELAAGRIVGHVWGRAEFGPRALGHRSILGDPRDATMQRRMNVAIKFRESFRPFAPAVLKGRQSEWFDLQAESPYMLLVAPVARQHWRQGDTRGAQGIALLNQVRSAVPAITHVDHSARVQTVDAATSPRFAVILRAFDRRTGCPVLVNTSFNIRGEPIVNDAADAYRCFMFTDMDTLVVGNRLMRKSEQPPMEGAEAYKRSFKLD